ncbi:hypothetical protein OWM07_02345 [Deferribacter thermophilus]|uniref:F0F1 ATP synthase subunit B family protein n=1 Tax=Deferribacter thermophilus TaxID=53573 RepID=UPI003C290717
MINLDITLFLQIINFLLILFIGKKLIFDPVNETVNKRDSRINSLRKSAEEMLAEINKLKSEYEAKLAAVKKEISEYQSSVRQEAVNVATEKVSKVKSELDKKVEEARKQIEVEKEKAKVELKTEAEKLSEMIVEKIIKVA